MSDEQPRCPKCGREVASATVSGPSEAVLSPCGHTVPVAFLDEVRDSETDGGRTAVESSAVLKDGANTAPPLVIEVEIPVEVLGGRDLNDVLEAVKLVAQTADNDTDK